MGPDVISDDDDYNDDDNDDENALPTVVSDNSLRLQDDPDLIRLQSANQIHCFRGGLQLR